MHLRPEDPHPWPHWLILGATLLLAVAVIFFQQFALALGERTVKNAPARVVADERADPPALSDLTLASMWAVKVAALGPEMAEEWDVGTFGLDELERLAVSRAQRLRLAIVVGELEGPEAALARLETLEQELTPGGRLAADAHWLARLYRHGLDELDPAVQDSLVARHGWFGRLAIATMLDPDDPRRLRVVGGGEKIAASGGWFCFFYLLGAVGGVIVLAVLLCWRLSTKMPGRLGYGGGEVVYLETYAVFLAGFMLLLGLHLGAFGLGIGTAVGTLIVLEVLLWSLCLTAFWGLFRGKDLRTLCREIGLHRGAGVGKEVMCGVAGFAALLPLGIAGMLLGGLIEIMLAEGAAPPDGYPVMDRLGASWPLVWLGVLSAVLWAPFVEETVTRGALQRYLRGRLGVVWAIVISALVFGAIHPYTPAGLIAVAFGGVGFAILREWRGSLIAAMVAHALFNGMISLQQLLQLHAITGG